MNAPSAFREGDSATRSRVEKLPETTKQKIIIIIIIMRSWREQGRHHPPPVPRRTATKIWSCTYPHPGFPPHTPGIQRGQGERLCSRSAAVTRFGDASRGGRRGLCGGARLCRSLPCLPCPSPYQRPRVQIWSWHLADSGRRLFSPRF